MALRPEWNYQDCMVVQEMPKITKYFSSMRYYIFISASRSCISTKDLPFGYYPIWVEWNALVTRLKHWILRCDVLTLSLAYTELSVLVLLCLMPYRILIVNWRARRSHAWTKRLLYICKTILFSCLLFSFHLKLIWITINIQKQFSEVSVHANINQL